ncbi:MAG: hypothetical protein WD770_02085 [Actinomycetota bacterium]
MKESTKDVAAPREVLDRPESQAEIEAGIQRAREGRTTPGMTSDEIRELAREHPAVEA